MKIADKDYQVYRGQEGTENTFRINASAKAFEILSSGLYSDKISAIIRELSCNSADSHVMAKNDNPFDIHLPNQMEPNFSIRDYGVALSDEEVDTIYTTYFESDKTHTNDLTGCLGLGSKSPFSYTDNFTVTSFLNGVKNVFNAFINESGIPTITKLHSESTDEPNGLEVNFAVKGKDHDEFEEKAAKILKWFKVKPNVSGASNFEFQEDDEYLLEGDGYKITKSSRQYRDCASYVLMGNVAYPLHLSDLGSNAGAKLDDAEKKLIQHGVELFVPLGSCDVSASREKLGYTKLTVTSIKEVLKKVIKDLYQQVNDKITKAKTLWEARCVYHELINNEITAEIVKVSKDQLLWNGSVVSDQIKNSYLDPNDNTTPIRRCSILKLHWRNPLRYSYRGNGKVFAKDDLTSIVAHHDHVVIINDVKKGMYSLSKTYMQANDIKEAYLITVKEGDNFVKDFQLDEICLYVSDFPKPERSTSERRYNKTSKAVTFDMTLDYSEREGDFWDNVEVDLDEGGIYVDVKRYKWSNGNDYASPESLADVVRTLKGLGKAPEAVYGLRSGLADKVSDDENWVELRDYCVEVFEGIKHDYVSAKRSQIYDRIDFGDLEKKWFEKLEGSSFAVNSPFGSVVEELKAYRSYSKDNDKHKFFFRLLNRMPKNITKDLPEIDVDGVAEKMTKKVNNLEKEYPILEHLHEGYSDNGLYKLVFDYVNLIDQTDDPQAQKKSA